MMSMRRLLTAALVCTAAQAAAIGLFRRQRRRYAGGRRHVLITQGGAHLRPAGDEIDDAVVSVMMGGAVLDLRDSMLPRTPVHLDILSVMGGIHLVVPADWKVQVDVEPTMGGIRDARSGRVDPERHPDVIVSGRVVMGGLAISTDAPGRKTRPGARAPR